MKLSIGYQETKFNELNLCANGFVRHTQFHLLRAFRKLSIHKEFNFEMEMYATQLHHKL